jgi:hypothetical protein
MFQNTGSKDIFKDFVDLLSLAIRLRAIGRTMDQVSFEGRVLLLPKVTNKLLTLVRDYQLRNSIQA